jgi:hypothetical protein
MIKWQKKLIIKKKVNKLISLLIKENINSTQQFMKTLGNFNNFLFYLSISIKKINLFRINVITFRISPRFPPDSME